MKQGKQFFCEQKNQKLHSLARTFPKVAAQAFKSLLLLFFRKEGLSSFTIQAPIPETPRSRRARRP
jgi:hypothetical protein